MVVFATTLFGVRYLGPWSYSQFVYCVLKWNENNERKESTWFGENDNRQQTMIQIGISKTKPCISNSPFDPNPNWGNSRWVQTKLKKKTERIERDELICSIFYLKHCNFLLKFSLLLYFDQRASCMNSSFAVRNSLHEKLENHFENYPKHQCVIDSTISSLFGETRKIKIVYSTQSYPWIAYIDLHPNNCYEIVFKEEYFPDKFICF